mmetsp:Transcript_21614/g.27506  ORF Transcript_21614/g.27506 Transcript_21614/m.27506 type:complete len:512 (+) Transcript_21614:3-1538(+)
MSGRTQVVYQKIEHARWRLPAHKGKLNCLHVRTITSNEGKPQNRVYTGGDDGVVKVWGGKDGRILLKINGASSSPITCITFAHSCIFIANGHGEIIRFDANGTPQRKWKAHERKVTCFQVVNQKRVFSGSLDCKVKLFSENSEVLRQFPSDPDDCREGILQLQVVPGNLLFTASDAGVIRVYNMKQELLKTLRTSSLEGVPIRSMHIQTCNNKISVFIGNNIRLTTWYLTLTEDECKNSSIKVDAVKALEGRITSGYITALRSVFVNPLKTKEPTVFLASNCGDIFLYIPTTKIEAAAQGKAFVEAQKFKSYTFKDSHSPIHCIGYAGSRLYAGTTAGNLLMWKEPYNMTRLLSVCSGQSDEHPYNNNVSTTKKIVRVSETPSCEIPVQAPNHDNLMQQVTNQAMLLDLSAPSHIEHTTDTTNNLISLLDSSTSDLMNLPSFDVPLTVVPTSPAVPTNPKCCICHDRSKDSALYECGHACVCFECGNKLVVTGATCPVCSVGVSDCLKFYQ